jgi:cysteine desulfurase
MARLGLRVTSLEVDENGELDLDQVRNSVTKDTAIVSVMLANNETGILFPVESIAEIVKEMSDALVHVDAVNAAGKVRISLENSNIDLLSISAHKFHGPKGVGALYIRRGVDIPGFIFGGGQEGGRRGGTEAVHQIVGLGKAAEMAGDISQTEKIRMLRNHLENEILNRIPNSRINGTPDPAKRLPNTSNISFVNTNGEAILARLNDIDVCVSTGSACNANDHSASPVLQAMNIPYREAMGAIRFSLGRYNTRKEIDFVLEQLPRIITELRSMGA